jgi:diketogulonate reductase-like aldo/keto reductase
VATTAYTSLGGARFKRGSQWGDALGAPARAHGATEAQVALRWGLQQGAAVIPGASSEAHIAENLALPPFALSTAELATIAAAPPPSGWFDARKGPAKYDDEAATALWGPR